MSTEQIRNQRDKIHHGGIVYKGSRKAVSKMENPADGVLYEEDG